MKKKDEPILYQALYSSPDFQFKMFPHVWSLDGGIVLPHYHNAFEIVYVQSGSGQFIVNGSVYPLCENEILIINPNETHSGKGNEHSVFYSIVFHQRLFQCMEYSDDYKVRILPLLSGQKLLSNGPSKSNLISDIPALIERFLASVQKPDLYSCGILLELFSEILDRHESIPLISTAQQQKNRNILQAIDYIQHNLINKISSAEVANALNLELCYFCRSFKKQTSYTVLDYIKLLRIHKACLLLKDAKQSIASIASECGYDNISYFNKIFKEQMHKTPSEYRNGKQES